MNDNSTIAKLLTNGILDYLLNNKATNIEIKINTESSHLTIYSQSHMLEKPHNIDQINSSLNSGIDKNIDLYYSELLSSSDRDLSDFTLVSSIVDSGKIEYDVEYKELYIELIRNF